MSALLEAFDRQVAWCRQPSPFSAHVLARSRLWLASEETALAAFAAVAADPLEAAVALRWLAGLHHLALRGLQPWADLWPPITGPVDDDALDAAIAFAWQTQQPALLKALALPPQTNEVQRSAALLPGLLHVAAQTPLPLALVEIGASAGLNLWCDQYRHEHAGPPHGRIPACAARRQPSDHGGWAWGSTEAALTLRSEWLGAAPPMPALAIVSRAGCDAMPIDLRQLGEGLRLASFIWPDQPERLARLRAAQAVASACMARSGLRVQAAHAADFVRQQLQRRVLGQALVLMHSVVWQYIPHAEQDDIRAQMEAAGRVATAAAPLAWLRFEPPALDLAMELRCRFWPGGEDRLLARCHPHGARIEWLPEGPSA